MQFDYFDIHSHLNFPQYETDREEIIKKLKAENIGTITVGTDIKTSQEAIDLADKHENLFATIGLHPADDPDIDHVAGFDESQFEKLVIHPKVVAIGECGLDYARLTDPEKQKKIQKEDFEKQIDFAVKHNKPLMIHCRDAYPDALDILSSKQKQYGEKVRGNFHFFTSPIDIAKRCLEIGFTVSFTGPITYSAQYNEVVSYVPLEKMMAETDAPFAAPVPYRGKRNEPAYVKEVVKKIAEIKNIDLDTVKNSLANTIFQVFFNKN
jgi:TatD DNase family protein